ncbi:MAG TPA: 50S ribosomal protein L11 methyltransferase [Ilumatobacteraceae bacterium]|nr:50S ribosomal protein L11 methyltransferase [Ilumatobacteraceae bacterium]
MFVVTVAESDVELASDVLWGLGVRAIEERSASDGRVELWTAVGDEPAAVDRAASALAGRWAWRRVEVDDATSETWREFAAPMWIDETLVVVPAWQEHAFDAGVTAIVVEPAGAFGLGDHPTTALCLGALRRLVRPGADVLDVGCGTGVLSVAAALLGARTVRAVDIASAAVEATADNARRNGVVDRIGVDNSSLAVLDGDFDVVVANILAPALVEMADELRRLTAPGGALVVSGVLAARHDHVLAALHPLVVERTDVHDGWAAVTLRHDDAGRPAP